MEVPGQAQALILIGIFISDLRGMYVSIEHARTLMDTLKTALANSVCVKRHLEAPDGVLIHVTVRSHLKAARDQMPGHSRYISFTSMAPAWLPCMSISWAREILMVWYQSYLSHL